MTSLTDSLEDGDQNAWMAFYDRHVHEIYGFVLRLVNSDSHVAEDLLQEIWLQAARSIKNFDPSGGEIRSWLFVVARRQVALHWRRKLSPNRAIQIGNEQIEDAQSGTLLPEDVLEQLERSAVINAALLSLSPERRQILNQKYRDGVSIRSMAHQAGKSEKAMESLLARARSELRCLLGSYFDPQPIVERPP